MQLLPIVEILANAETAVERARWLLTVPDVVVYRDFDPIRLLLQERRLGVEYLRMRHAVLHATRGADGLLPGHLAGALDDLRAVMLRLSRSAPDASDRAQSDA